MKWLIAPDSFKNCLRSPQVAAQLAAGIRDISPDDEIIELPLADGGEGTAEAAARAAGGTLESVPVTGPLGNPVEARFARLPAGTAVVEMAEAAGLERLPDGKNDPLRATTYGVGELFLKLLKNGTRDFVIGIGGSATVDGGLGFVQALGAVCRDAQGRIIPPGAGGGALSEVAALDCSALPPELVQARIRIGSDVTNPLTGPRGAARVFGPQKGAGPGQVETLEAGLRRWAELWRDAGDVPGDGAAGGLGFLLRRLDDRIGCGTPARPGRFRPEARRNRLGRDRRRQDRPPEPRRQALLRCRGARRAGRGRNHPLLRRAGAGARQQTFRCDVQHRQRSRFSGGSVRADAGEFAPHGAQSRQSCKEIIIMSIAVISTGTELLKGTVLNTNLAFLGRELGTLGLSIRLALIAGDREQELYTACAEALAAADTLIISGGLGPTRDDITLDATARFFGLELEPHPELVEKVTAFWHERHRGRVPGQVLRQARAPRGAAILPNPNGSASGFRIDTVYDSRPRRIYLLPGPPREFEPMAHASLLPELARSMESEGHEYTLGFLAAGEPEFQLQVRFEKALEGFPVELAYCATPAGTRVFVSGSDSGQVRNAAELARSLSGPWALPFGELELPAAVLAELGRTRRTLVTAESCTGGMISAALTAVPGASNAYLGGAVVYSNRLKHRLLGVPQEILDRFGAVSAECAGAMVDGATERLGGDCAIAVTGIAGPAGDDTDKPVGLVYIGVRAGEKRSVEEFHFRGDRNAVRERSCGSALLMLYRLLKEDEVDSAAGAGR